MKSQGGRFNRAPRQLSGRDKGWRVSESSLVPTGVRHPMAISGKSGPTSTRTSGGHCPSLFSTQVLLRLSSLRGPFSTRIAQPKKRSLFHQPTLFRPLAITEATEMPLPQKFSHRPESSLLSPASHSWPPDGSS